MKVQMLVVGAGSTGSAVALHLARAGFRVLVVDGRPMHLAGAHWWNAVPVGLAAQAGLDPALLSDGAVPLQAIAMNVGPRTLHVGGLSSVTLHMPTLVGRLPARASEAGATFQGSSRVLGLESVGTGVVATLDGSRTVEAEAVVDATGLSGFGRSLWAPLARACPSPSPEDLCSGAMEVRRVPSPEAARVAVANWGDASTEYRGEVSCRFFRSGAYSVEQAGMHGDDLLLLAGTIPAEGHPRGTARIHACVAGNPAFEGHILVAGAAPIPIRRPYDWPVSGRVALVGTAACQVLPLHASGVAVGLVAARILADSLLSSPGDPARGLVRYAVRFQREWGGFLAGSALMVRWSRGLGAERVSRLWAAGLLTPTMLAGGFEHRMTMPRLAEGPALWGGFTLEPGLAREAAAVVAKMGALMALYRAFPGRDDPALRSRWAARAARVGGWEADPG